VLSVGANAEYGRAPQTILLATKSGGNQLHGSIFGYGRNQSLIATDYFSDPANGGLGKQPFTRAQYGGSIGGPLVKNHVWYFGAIERIAQSFIDVDPRAAGCPFAIAGRWPRRLPMGRSEPQESAESDR
jgi:hypothetical protein